MLWASRVTIDIDSYTATPELSAVRAYHGLDRQAEKTVVRVSSSGEGFHIVGYFLETLTDEQEETIRRTLGDDRRRIELDTLPDWHRRRAVNNVLWDRKGDKTVEHVYDDVYAALDHVSGSATPV